MNKCKVEDCDKQRKSLGYCEMHYYRVRRHGNPFVKKDFKGKRKPITYKVDENGCHICNSHFKNVHGYPKMYWKGKGQNAHRVIYQMKHGDLDKKTVVRHKCDVRNCININHLELGTHKDNSQDMVRRNRHHYGEINRNSKLTKKEVLQIRDLTKLYSQRELAKMYNVGKTTVARVQNRIMWTHI